MTILDSDRARVAPVFNWLVTRDPSGRSWFRRLLAATAGPTSAVPDDPGQLREATWWPRPVSLPEPKSLVAHLDRLFKDVERAMARGEHPEFRPGDCFELSQRPRPNALLVTARVMMLVECRAQDSDALPVHEAGRIVRSLDALFDYKRSRMLACTLITDASDPTADTMQALRAEIASALNDATVLATYLPHRSPSERQTIASGFLGMTTWKQVCRELGVPWTALPEAVLDVPSVESDWLTRSRSWDPKDEGTVVVGRDLDPALESHRLRLAKRASAPFPPMTLTDAARRALQAFYRSGAWRELRDAGAGGSSLEHRPRAASSLWRFALPHDAKVLAAIDWHADLLDGTWDDAVDDALARFYGGRPTAVRQEPARR